MADVREIPRTHNPFSRDGVGTVDGVPAYDALPATLLDMLRAHVEARPDADAVAELGGERLSYRELWERSAVVAGWLADQGLERGDRVAIRYPAGLTWVLAFWGTLMAGGVAVAPNTRWTESETRFVLDDSGARIDLSPDTGLGEGKPTVVQGLGADDVAAFFYTSGTTGHPKGVPTTHRAFVTNAENMVRCLGLAPDRGEELRTLISVPLFHVTGCNSQLLTAALTGGSSVIMPVLDLPRLAPVLAEEQVTFMVTVPAVYSLMLRHPSFAETDVSSVRWVGYGGAPIAPSLVASLQQAFPGARVFNGYGMTETASLMTVLPHEDAVEHADSVGYAVPSVDLGVLPLDEADPQVGELVSRGANITHGYWQRDEANAATFVDGWLHTGDIVRVDEAGRVHIVDRAKDIINRGGENVSSVEVEAALLAVPGVADAAVLAVPDEVMGEKVGAVLVPVEGLDGPLDVDAVLAQVGQGLADYKIPQYVNVVDQPLPRNAGGKLLKAQLRNEISWGEQRR